MSGEYYEDDTCDFCRWPAKYRCICGKAVCEDCTALCDVCEDTFCKKCVDDGLCEECKKDNKVEEQIDANL